MFVSQKKNSYSNTMNRYDRFEALLLLKDTKIENLSLQVEVEVKSCLSSSSDTKELSETTKSQIRRLVQNDVMNPNSRLVTLVRSRLRHVLCVYLQASTRDFRSILAESRMQFLLPDLERLARPKSAITLRSGRRRRLDDTCSMKEKDQSEGILRTLFRHHWAVHAPYYVPIIVCGAQHRAKEMLSS